MLRTAFLVFALATSLWAENADEFIPFYADLKLTYKGTFENNQYQDTIIPVIEKKGQYDILYFISREGMKKAHPALEQMAGLGVFEKRPDGLYTYDCFWQSDLASLNKETPFLFIRNPITVKDLVRIEMPAETGIRVIEVLVAGFEDVQVPAAKFKRALRLEIRDFWPKDDSFPDGVKYQSTAWFVKGLGLVKWIRSTGRIDELVSYEKLGPNL